MKSNKNKIAQFVTEVVEEGYENKHPTFYVISREEFQTLKLEHAKEVENLSYDEYCEIECECWHDMLKEQLKLPWEKNLPCISQFIAL